MKQLRLRAESTLKMQLKLPYKLKTYRRYKETNMLVHVNAQGNQTQSTHQTDMQSELNYHTALYNSKS